MLEQMRAEYSSTGLDEVNAGNDPIALFRVWMSAATEAHIVEPNAMALATADADGAPSVRTVLLKGFDADGVVFFSNYDSRKGHELALNPRAAAVMLWHPLQRQVRIEGAVTRVSAAESDAYFASRPLGAQLGAIASPQSQPVANRAALESHFAQAAAQAAAQFRPGDVRRPVRRPAHWGGYRIALETIEFWQGRHDRMHDRLRFRREDSGSNEAGRAPTVWRRERLAP